jgi:hypothetical protein
MHWFEVIGNVLQDPAIMAENVDNMDETGIMLSKLNSVKVLVSKDNQRGYRGARVKRTTVTAIECISADGRCLDPLIIWPAAGQLPAIEPTGARTPLLDGIMRTPTVDTLTPRSAWSGSSLCLTPKPKNGLTGTDMRRLRDARNPRNLRVLFRTQHHPVPYPFLHLPQTSAL